MSFGSHASNLTYKDTITCTNVVISLLILSYTHMYWFVSPHLVRYNCVDVDEYDSLSSAIIPVLPIASSVYHVTSSGNYSSLQLGRYMNMHLYRLTRSVIIGHLHDYRVSLELLWNDFAVSSVDLLNKISQLKPMLGRIYTSLAFVYLSTAWLALAIGDPWEKKAGHCNSVERDCF